MLFATLSRPPYKTLRTQSSPISHTIIIKSSEVVGLLKTLSLTINNTIYNAKDPTQMPHVGTKAALDLITPKIKSPTATRPNAIVRKRRAGEFGWYAPD